MAIFLIHGQAFSARCKSGATRTGTALGAVATVVAWWLWTPEDRRYRAQLGTSSGAFLAGYGVARILVEVFREPDAHLGFLLGFTTMGQLLSLPMLIAGLGLIYWGHRRRPAQP